MARAKKEVIVLVVEGTSDRDALELNLENVYDSAKIQTWVMSSDITSQNSRNDSRGPGQRIRDAVLGLLKTESIYHLSDIKAIYMVTDLDGCFIPDEAVKEEASIKANQYSRMNILTRDRARQLDTKRIKAKNIQKLLSNTTLKIRNKDIPFSLFFMSCNLEDAFYGKQNNTAHEKQDMALGFADQFSDDPAAFLEVLQKGLKAVLSAESFPMDIPADELYRLSWNTVQQDFASLQSGTNLVCMLISDKDFVKEELKSKLNEIISPDCEWLDEEAKSGEEKSK